MIAPDFEPTFLEPTLKTPRLLMRPLTDADLIDLCAILGDPLIMQHTATGQPKTPSMTASYLHSQQEHQAEHGFSLWGIIRLADNRLIGQCGLAYLPKTEETALGYTIAYDCWNQGYGTEATTAWLTYGFEALELDRIIAAVKPENSISLRILDKLGLKYDRQDTFYGCTCAYYAIKRDQWKAASSGLLV